MLTKLIATLKAPFAKADIVDLQDGFVRVVTDEYQIEIPHGWHVGGQTSFGQRTFKPSQEEIGFLEAMTGSADGETWEALYKTALFYIQKDTAGTPTSYTLSHSAQGYEAISFSMMNGDVPTAHYVIFKNTEEEILVLSVTVPDRASDTKLAPVFERLVSTAKML